MDELRSALELATEDELQQLTQLLFARGLNPLDYFQTPEPMEVQSRDRQSCLDALEDRFRYLAADGATVLRGCSQEVNYRQILIKVCRYLKIPYSEELSTTDLEAEVFLHILGRACEKLPASEKEALRVEIEQSLASSELDGNVAIAPSKNSSQFSPPEGKFSKEIALLLKGGGALAVTSIVKPILLQQLARQFAIHFAKHQLAKQTLIKGGATAATQFQSYITLQMASRGMALSAARYGAVRSVLGFLGPAMWTWFLADLGWRSISTNYGRIIPTIFALAQIRLIRSEKCWEVA